MFRPFQELLSPDVFIDLTNFDVVLVHVLELRMICGLLHLAQLFEQMLIHLAKLLSFLYSLLASVHLRPPQKCPWRLHGKAVHFPFLVDEISLLRSCIT